MLMNVHAPSSPDDGRRPSHDMEASNDRRRGAINPKTRAPACLACHQRKIKCQRESKLHVCEHCREWNVECITPSRRLGRVLGSKNQKTLMRRQQMATAQKLSQEASRFTLDAPARSPTSSETRSSGAATGGRHYSPPFTTPISRWEALEASSTPEESDSNLSPITSNPLQMFATVSEAMSSGTEEGRPPALFDFVEMANVLRTPCLELYASVDADLMSEGFAALFNPKTSMRQPTLATLTRMDAPRLDSGPSLAEYDPIELNLASSAEAEFLYGYFFEHIQPVVRLLDPSLYVLDYVRSKSCLLLTVILEAAAAYCSDASVYRRLARHANWLCGEVCAKGFQSVYICQALQIRSAWLQLPSDKETARSWQYMLNALTMAIELRLDQLEPLSATADPEYATATQARKDRLVRNCQRTFLCLFNRERTLAAMSGRKPMLSEGPLTSTPFVETWNLHPQACPQGDLSLISAVTLRKMLPGIQSDVVEAVRSGTANFEAVTAIVDTSLKAWSSQWPHKMGTEYHRFSIAVMGTRFLLLSSPYEQMLRQGVLSGKDREQCLLSALEFCRDTVGIYQLRNAEYRQTGTKSFTATMTFAMVMYAALFALKLLEHSDSGQSLDASLCHLALLAELGLQLGKAGEQLEHSTSGAEVIGEHILAEAQRVARAKASQVLPSEGSAEASGFSLSPLATVATPLPQFSQSLPYFPEPDHFAPFGDTVPSSLWAWPYELAGPY